MTLDIFDRAFQKCTKEEQEQILNMEPSEFGRALADELRIKNNKKWE